MQQRFFLRLAAGIPALLLFGLSPRVTETLRGAEPARVDFNRDIRPLLSNRCYKCHGPDEAERKGGADGLRLDTAPGSTEDLGGYAAIVPGKPEDSELLRRITAQDAGELMPPPEAGPRLSADEVQRISQWIREGAEYAKHWSYAPPVRHPVPEVRDASWPREVPDRFLLARLDQEGLAPAAEADRYELIRRLSLDLTGLPPSLEEVERFVHDPDPAAYERLMDRLLAAPGFGERWGQMWLDLARYADSAGYADDPPRTIWLYRDYVIRSLNANKSFDQFTREQLAGDLLPGPSDEQLMATAFHRNTLTNNEGGTNDEEFRNVAIVDRVNTTMAVWMGTTMACAQCHTHKYDPISQTEYFRFFAIFNNTEDADRRDESPLLSVFTESQQWQRQQWQAELAQVEQQLQAETPELQAGLEKWDREFPRDVSWQVLPPREVQSVAKSQVELPEDGTVRVAGGAKTDTYTVLVPAPAAPLAALRLEVLPDDGLPGKGPGHAQGNFVLAELSVVRVPPRETRPQGRFLRIALPGPQRILSLAEVQVYSGTENLARGGEASQSSTDYGGDAQRAVDGNTDGRYQEAASTTHTRISDDPWWELDLRRDVPVERVLIWNRTDATTVERLQGFRVQLLDEQRRVVWEETVAEPPRPSRELAVSGRVGLSFDTAVADYSQAGYDAKFVLDNPDPKQKGWAVGGQTGQPHTLTLIAKEPVEVPAGSSLAVTLRHAESPAEHTLGKFRIAASSDGRAREWARTPLPVIAALQLPEAQRSPEQRTLVAEHYRTIAAELAPARERRAALQKMLAEMSPLTVPICRELPADKLRTTRIQHRGNFLDLGDEVQPGTPAAFPPLPDSRPANRLGLAEWLVDEGNPLTARVMANRFWEQLFGIGIVSTSEEFGAQGELPVHPELLDWLATELVRQQWDVKAFLRMLVSSSAYRQSSRVTEELLERDPDNRLLARGPRFRLSAEAVRDQALFAGGLLSRKMYGPPVKPPQPALGISAAFGSGIDWVASEGEDRFRRALYTTWRRSNPYPSMSTFDVPNREVCTLRRVQTNTPLQALVTLNDPVFVEAAQALARRMVRNGGETPAERASYGFRVCLARPPQAAEQERLVQLFEQTRQQFGQQPELAMQLAGNPGGMEAPGEDAADLAAWTVVANVLLNLDETLMKR